MGDPISNEKIDKPEDDEFYGKSEVQVAIEEESKLNKSPVLRYRKSV